MRMGTPVEPPIKAPPGSENPSACKAATDNTAAGRPQEGEDQGGMSRSEGEESVIISPESEDAFDSSTEPKRDDDKTSSEREDEFIKSAEEEEDSENMYTPSSTLSAVKNAIADTAADRLKEEEDAGRTSGLEKGGEGNRSITPKS